MADIQMSFPAMALLARGVENLPHLTQWVQRVESSARPGKKRLSAGAVHLTRRINYY
jgi:glutathione S-transferase